MKYYILANGEGTRWHNYKGVPKQLIEIDGETILHRMIRLLRAEGVKKDDIIICGPFEDADAKNIITKSKTKREVFEEVAKLAKGPFTILYGDCYYTEAIIHEIVTRPINKYDEFFTTSPNPNTGCQWEEGYAHRCIDWEWWRDEMHELNNSPDVIKVAKDWFIHWWLLGVKDEHINDLPVQCFNADHDIQWCDQTDDFDYPEDLDKFCEVTGHKCTNTDRPECLSVIIPTYNSAKTLKPLLDTLTAQRLNNTCPCEIIVVDDGSTDDTREVVASFGPFIKYIYQENKGVSAARNAGLEAATGRYISFVDADDMVSSEYVAAITHEMANGYDYCIFCWYHIAQEQTMFGFSRLIPWPAVWPYAFHWACIGKERFDEKLNVAEDVDFLDRVITEGKKRGQSTQVIYRYDWEANPDSLTKQFNRGDIKMRRA